MATTSTTLSRKEYLQKYVINAQDEKKTKKKSKKKKKKKPQTDSVGVLVVDEDPVWAKPVKIEEDDDEDDSAEEEKPQINEDIEVKRMKRMEQIRARRPYHGISEDGSGWVSVSDSPSNANDGDQLPVPKLERGLSPIIETNEGSESPHLSPPRRNRPNSQKPNDRSADISPPRRNRPNSQKPNVLNGDNSPPRRNRPNSQKTSDDLSGDISPPQRNRSHSQKTDLSGDISPPRRNRSQSQKNDDSAQDISPPRRNRPHSQITDAVSVEDLSPPRRNRPTSQKTSSDLSPPRKVSRTSPSRDLSPPRKSKSNSKEEARTGLLTGQEMRKEIERKKKEELTRYKELDPSVSGRGAEPVYRDKEGKRMSKEEVLKLQKGEEKPKEQKLEWGKGLAQKREAEAREQELELEKEKPFARTRDDPELDKMLKERVRWGDPMAHLVKPKHSGLVLEDFGDNEKMKESGFIIPQNIPSHSWITRRIDAAPNRYGIKPGRHWDGVDRSNGTEKEYFKRSSEKHATEKEAYLWSVSDM